MIALLSEDRCVGCNLCVDKCPTNVFESSPQKGANPTIARVEDCQTCFLCELYCPVDALYVHPSVSSAPDVDEAILVASGAMGGYAKAMGWCKAKPRGTDTDPTFHVRKELGV